MSNRFPWHIPHFDECEKECEVTNAMYEEYLDHLMQHNQSVAEQKKRHEIIRKKLEEQDQTKSS